MPLSDQEWDFGWVLVQVELSLGQPAGFGSLNPKP